MSIEELQTLLPKESVETSAALEQFLVTDQVISKEVITSLGEIAPRGSASLLGRRTELQNLAGARLERAERFVVRLSRICAGIEMVGVSGSTAYGAAKESDDIDFFLVTLPGRVWTSLLIAILLARLERLKDPRSPVFCFNRVLDNRQCTAEFRETRDPLVAREALSLHVVIGKDFYKKLLDCSPWMADTFPRLYRSRTDTYVGSKRSPHHRNQSRIGLSERAALAVLGPYLWMAGLQRNRWLKKHGRENECFRTIIGKSICAFESDLYEELRTAYGRAFS